MKKSNRVLLITAITVLAAAFIIGFVVRLHGDFKQYSYFNAVVKAGTTHSDNKIVGSGSLITKNYKIDLFNKIDLHLNSNVAVHVAQSGDEQSSIMVSSDTNIVPYVVVRVSGNTLYLESKDGVKLRPSGRIDVTLMVAKGVDINTVDVEGANNLIMDGIFGNELLFSVSGANHARLSGSVNKLKVDVSGAGMVNAKELSANDVDVDASGATEVKVTAHKTLKLDLSGMSSATYFGNPAKVSKDVSGLVGVTKGD